MNVQQMVNFMALQSISSDIPSPDEQVDYLTWLNIAYNELYSDICTMHESWMIKQVNINITNGVANPLPNPGSDNLISQFPTDFFRQIRMLDLGNCGVVIPMWSIEQVLDTIAGNTGCTAYSNYNIIGSDWQYGYGCGGNGNPSCSCSCCSNPLGSTQAWFITNQTTINTYPQVNQTVLQLWYIPTVPPLALNTQENQISIPIPFQDAIPYRALMDLYASEENFRSAAGMARASARYEQRKTALFSYLARNYDDNFQSIITEF